MEPNVIIYGAGDKGRAYYNFLEKKGISNIVYGFCDRDYQRIQNVNNVKVYNYDDIKHLKLIFILALSNKSSIKEVKSIMELNGSIYESMDFVSYYAKEDRVCFNRELCSFFHINAMDDYFERAESDASLASFWKDDSVFYIRFKILDLSEVIELACGRGRHVPQYIKKAGHVTLVDILPENIDYCRERFKGFDKISYYCNNGYNLEKLQDNSYSALFCYDAMVHFELIDIYEYLKDIYRVLQKGGYALIHHSNNGMDYKASFVNSYNGRSFMTKQIFAYLAYRAGFQVVDQEIISWEIKDIDAVSLIQKV